MPSPLNWSFLLVVPIVLASPAFNMMSVFETKGI